MAYRGTDLYSNRAHIGAYNKGYDVGKRGGSAEENPYSRNYDRRGRGTWAGGYFWAWKKGWEDATGN